MPVNFTARERERQAEEHGGKAIALRMAGQSAEALQHADQGIALVESLLTERPGDPNTTYVLASQLYTRAAIYEQLGQPERGIVDARRSMELYQQLAPLDDQVADLDARAAPRVADAMARLGRLLALAPDDSVPTFPSAPGRASQACDAVISAERIYTDLAAFNPHYRASLARTLFTESDVFRLVNPVDGQDLSAVIMMTCIKALEIYWSPDFRFGDEDRHYYALTLLQAARLHEHEAAEMLEIVDVAGRAAEQLLDLVTEGGNYHGYLVEALHLLSVIMEGRGDPGWDQPLVLARDVLEKMGSPLPDEIAVLERSIQERSRRAAS